MVGHPRARGYPGNSRGRKQFFSSEKFRPGGPGAAPHQRRPSRSIPNCVGPSAGRGRGAPGRVPRIAGSTPPTRAPLWQTKCHGRPGSLAPPPPDETPVLGGSEGEDVGRGRREVGGAGASLAPAGPSPRVPARPPAAPILRPASPPGTRALQGAGIPAHPKH